MILVFVLNKLQEGAGDLGLKTHKQQMGVLSQIYPLSPLPRHNQKGVDTRGIDFLHLRKHSNTGIKRDAKICAGTAAFMLRRTRGRF